MLAGARDKGEASRVGELLLEEVERLQEYVRQTDDVWRMAVRKANGTLARVEEFEAATRELFLSADMASVADIDRLMSPGTTTNLEPDEPDRSAYAWFALARLVGLVDSDGEAVPDAIAMLRADGRKDGGT